MKAATRFEKALEALWAAGGRPERDDDDDLLGVVVRMMLAQATSKANASQAFGNLVDRFVGDWDRIRRAPVAEVADAIAVGGLSNQKAPRIQALLARVHDDFGDYTLESLREKGAAEALDYLLTFDGIGPTTARFALMYATGFDVFPINGGIRRVLERLEVLDGTESDLVRHAKAQKMLPEGDAYAAHMTLVRHARRVCKKTPLCDACAARPVCPYGSSVG